MTFMARPDMRNLARPKKIKRSEKMTLIDDVKGFKKDIPESWKHNEIELNFNSGSWIQLKIWANHGKKKKKSTLYFKNLVKFYNWLYEKWNLYIEEVRCEDKYYESLLILYLKDAKE